MIQRIFTTLLIFTSIITCAFLPSADQYQSINPNPPDNPVKIIFIHHSTGENWLSDDNGGLARALLANNYFVSDTNYGWGPDSIGDRTDIPNWLEWFRSDGTERIMNAVFSEKEIHSPYDRAMTDPGGENQVIMFKSCFPNSELAGNPNDPPSEGTDFTVGNAKYVYNEILQYFQTRPDKLFIVITAPPLTDGTYAKNARAFNNWLVNDWRSENNYTLSNVAVFDFYNVLTAPENHHWVKNGVIEHVIGSSRNTEYYPSDDAHPSQAGNLKATEEFLPMLNTFYHRWQAAGVPSPVPASGNGQAPADEPMAILSELMLDDFEMEQSNWEAYKDESESSQMLCYPAGEYAYQSRQSLQLDFDIPTGSWGTCSLFFDSAMEMSAADGVLFYLRAAEPGAWMHVDLYAGPEESRETYYYEVEVQGESSAIWVEVRIPWTEFVRASWEEDAGTPFNKADQVTGLAFGFPEVMDGVNQGTVWVDNLQLFTTQTKALPAIKDDQTPAIESEVQVEPAVDEPELSKPGLPFCGGAAMIPVVLIAFSFYFHNRRK